MARKRASKKRVDYRKGGRVSARIGGRRQFSELDAVMPTGGRRLGKRKNPTTPKPTQTLIEEPLKKETSPPNYVSGEPPRQMQQDQKTSSGYTTRLKEDPRLQQAARQRETAFRETQEGNDGSQITDNRARLRPEQARLPERTRVGNRMVETGKRTTGGGRQNMANVSETVELSEQEEEEAAKLTADAQAKAKAKAAAEAADPTKNDPAKDLMNRVPDENNPTYTPVAPTVDKLNVGNITADSTDAEKLKAGISTNVQSLTSRTGLSDPTDISATNITADTAIADSATLPEDIDAASYEADLVGELDPTKVAQGKVSREAKARGPRFRDRNRVDTARRDALQEEQAMAVVDDYSIDSRAFVDPQTGEVAQITKTREEEARNREAITGKAATGDEAKIIDTVGYEAAQRRPVKGTAAKGAAADMIAEVGDLPKEITSAIVEDPASVEAAIDDQPVEVRAAVAALPTEALVSSQMETLLGGLEDGETPAWARPAVAQVEQLMAARGLSASTVGRDALFNAIIQSAMPIAQNNATALQQRAAQNLTNQQQANMQQATQDMQRRMANLSNRQTAASQTAANAQQMATMQSQFRQQAILQGAGSDQQVLIQNLQNRQQAAMVSAQNQQATNAQNLSNDQQMQMANLQLEAERLGANQSAENQQRLAQMQIAADFLGKNAGFAQQMKMANLNNEQQMELANLTAMNQADSESLNSDQQIRLANLNARLQTNLAQGRIAAEMNQAQLTADQQRAVQNASMIANVDLNKFNAAQQVELANSRFMQSMSVKDFDARQQSAMQNATTMASMDLAAADQRTKLAITNAQNFLQMDMANLNNRQQGVILDQQMRQQAMLSNQAANNAAKQFNATSENQTNQFLANMEANMNQFNTSQSNAMKQFNTAEANRAKAINAQNSLEASKFNTQMSVQVNQFNESIDNQRDIWNAQNAQAVEQSNIEWRRKANTMDTAAQNAANQLNAQQAFGISSGEQNFIWQEMRDQAAYLRQAYENDQQRRTTLYATAIANETSVSEKSKKTPDQLVSTIDGIINRGRIGR